jgi:hypothetical protein
MTVARDNSANAYRARDLQPDEIAMALEMKSACERCGAALTADAPDARICSYECTFCASCSEALSGRCPNCGGELLARPRRQDAPGDSDVE